MKTKFRYDVYLAIGMHGRQVGNVLLQIGVAKAFCKKYKLTYYAPTDDEGLDNLPGSTIIDLKPDLDRMQWYVQKDDKHLDKCRTLLVLTGNTASSGTGWEMARMFYRNKRPIFIVSSKMYDGKLTNFTTVKASCIRPTIEDSIKSIKAKLRRK